MAINETVRGQIFFTSKLFKYLVIENLDRNSDSPKSPDPNPGFNDSGLSELRVDLPMVSPGGGGLKRMVCQLVDWMFSKWSVSVSS